MKKKSKSKIRYRGLLYSLADDDEHYLNDVREFTGDELIYLDTPERKLFFWVFLRAYYDIITTDINYQGWRHDAIRWFKSDDFLAAAEVFSPNPENFVLKIRRQLDKLKPIANYPKIRMINRAA